MANNVFRGARLIALTLASALPAFQASAARSDLAVNSGGQTVLQTQLTAAPAVLDVAGTVATVQFAGTPLCVGSACGIDGPAVAATLSATNVAGNAEATARYSFTVLGGPDLVPILLSGLYSVVNPPELPDGAGGTTAAASASVSNSLGAQAFVFQSICYNYTYFLNESGPPKNCGSGTFSGSFLASTGSPLAVVLDAFVGRTSPDAAPPDSVTAYIDPIFEIDPEWAALHSGYSLQFESGVGNGAPGSVAAAVPEPQTIVLLGAGLLALMARRRSPRP